VPGREASSRVIVLLVAVVCGLAVNPVGAGANGAVSAADSAMLDAALLTTQDFLRGWTESPNASSSATPNLAKYGPLCARLQAAADRAKKLQRARGRSSDFQHGDIDAISNSAAVFGTAAAANSALSVLERPAVAPCLKKAITAKVKRFGRAPACERRRAS
jgi:hypothetical protein